MNTLKNIGLAAAGVAVGMLVFNAIKVYLPASLGGTKA